MGYHGYGAMVMAVFPGHNTLTLPKNSCSMKNVAM